MTSFSPQFRDAIYAVRGTSNITAIRRAIELLRSDQPLIKEEALKIAAESDAQLDLLLAQIDDTSRELGNISNAVDRDLDEMLYNITIAIVTVMDAREAINLYDMNWFASLAKSIPAKICIANRLINCVGEFGQIPATLWNLIVASDPDTLNSIMFVGFTLSTDTVGSNT